MVREMIGNFVYHTFMETSTVDMIQRGTQEVFELYDMILRHVSNAKRFPASRSCTPFRCRWAIAFARANALVRLFTRVIDRPRKTRVAPKN